MPEDPILKKPDADEVIEEPKTAWCWIKNSEGQASATLTFVTIAFIVTTVAYVVAILQKIGPLELRSFDPAACAAYMGPIMSLYAFRRYTDKKFPQQ